MKGCVYLVGSGPGDPDLLTVRALRLIQSAGVVVYDRLVAPEILDLIPLGTTRIFAGKAPENHTLSQEEINDLIFKLAKAGHKVVRLKGGDPNVFGRGAEEADFLESHGIRCEMVPGVTAASGCSAAARVPLTYRGLASGVRYVTGHRRNNGELDLNWESLADPDTTLVVYMGLASMPVFRRELLRVGVAADTPVALVVNGTTPRQEVYRTTLDQLPDYAETMGVRPPVLTIIGNVAGVDSVRLTTETVPEEQLMET